MEDKIKFLKENIAEMNSLEEAIIIRTDDIDSLRNKLFRMGVKFTLIISATGEYIFEILKKEIEQLDVKMMISSLPLNVHLIHKRKLVKLSDGVIGYYGKIYKVDNKNVRRDTDIYIDCRDETLLTTLKKYSQYTLESVSKDVIQMLIKEESKLLNVLVKIELKR